MLNRELRVSEVKFETPDPDRCGSSLSKEIFCSESQTIERKHKKTFLLTNIALFESSTT